MINIFHVKKYGKNYLIDPNIRKKIISAAELKNEHIALEIGAGTGFLTGKIADSSKTVFAVEIDPDSCEKLKKLSKDNVVIINEDILKLDWRRFLNVPYKNNIIIGNLPYSISSQIILKLIDYKQLFSYAVVMVQKEFGNRLLAKISTKEYNNYTVLIKTFFKPEKLFDVSPNCFKPVPKIYSTVIKLVPVERKKDIKGIKKYRELVKCCFKAKRKTLVNSLSSNSSIDKPVIREILNKMNIDINIRSENLSVDDFIKLYDLLSVLK